MNEKMPESYREALNEYKNRPTPKVEHMEKVSSCCGVAPKCYSGDSSSEDYGICPDCHDHCGYVYPEEE